MPAEPTLAPPPPSVETTFCLKVITGRANPQLARDVAKFLGIDPCAASVGAFANGETSIRIAETVRGDDCYIVQPTVTTSVIGVNTALMELLLLIHTLKLSSARRITAVVPYFGYSRQDRKNKSRVPISASAVAQLIQCMGVHRVLTVDLHCGQIQGFFRNIPVDNLHMFVVFCDYLKRLPWFEPHSTVVVSPDANGLERATRLADGLGVGRIVTILKRRRDAGAVEELQTVGDVEGFSCIIVDDMIDTAGTLVKAADLLKDKGAVRVVACATHGLLSGSACERIEACAAVDAVVVSDSIPQGGHQCAKMSVIPLCGLLGNAIYRLHQDESLSSMFQAETS